MQQQSVYLSAAFSLTLLLGACSSGPTIIANQNPDANFTAYETFSFADPLSTDKSGARSILSGYLIKSTAEQLEARGMRQTANPDLLVDIMVSSKTKVSATSSSPSTYGTISRGRYGGRYGGTSMSMGVSTSSGVKTKTEGTVTIDVIDLEQKLLVWEGIAIGRVTDKTRENLQTVVPGVIAEMFAEYPVPVPGQEAKK